MAGNETSPSRAGFAAVARAPGVVATEIAWRWTFGAAALALLAMGAFAWLQTLTVSDTDQLMLRSRQPILMADAMSHILAGSGARLLRLLAVLLPAIAALWTVAATVGRALTLKKLVPASDVKARPIAGLNVLRAALALAALLAYLGAAFVASLVAGRGETLDPSIFLLVFIPLLAVVVLAWGTLNWYLSLAPVCAALNGSGTVASFAEAVRLSRHRAGAITSAGLTFGLIRAVALVVVFMVSVAIAEAPWMSVEVQIALLVVISLAYFVVADWLYMARLAAYIEIARRDAAPAVPATVPGDVRGPVMSEPLPEAVQSES
jgi:hypothetical protein